MRKVKRLLKENWIPNVEKIHATADARTQKNRVRYIPASGVRNRFMKVTSTWTLQKAQFAKTA